MEPDSTLSHDFLPGFIISEILMVHCMRGPKHCQKCKEIEAHKYCKLELFPDGIATRRVIEIKVEGDSFHAEFDVVQVFESKEQALAHAKKLQIPVLKEDGSLTV